MAVIQSKYVKKNIIALCCATVFLAVVLFVFNLMILLDLLFIKTKEITAIIELFLLLGIILFVYVTFSYINKSLISPLSKIKKAINAVKVGNVAHLIANIPGNEIGEIVFEYSEMAVSLQESQQKLKSQTSELSDKNWELHEANAELEASYGQLQAIIEQLNEAEEKYHSLVRNIPEIVCVIENTGIISFVNQVSCNVLGYDKSDLVGKNISDFISPNSKPILIDDILSILTLQSSYAIEISFTRKDGSTLVTEAKFTNYVFNGINMGLQAIIRDVTKRRSLEKAILQSNKELSILNSVSKSLTSTLDLDELCNVIVNEVTRTLECPGCILNLADKDSSTLKVKAFSGEFYSQAIHEPLFEPKSLMDEEIEKLLENSSTFKAEDIPDAWLTGKINKSMPPDKQINELLSVPVAIKDKKLGTIIVGFNSNVGESEINLISSIANNAAVAIDNALLYETSKKYFIKTVDALIATVEAKDNYTEGHSQRVSMYAVDIAEKMNLPKEQIEDIKVAGMLHDIGKIGISDTILQKTDKLTAGEYEVIKQHPLISNKILYPVGFSERTMKAIAFHHERFDGKGYPYGLTGDTIAIEAQIISVADAYDAMTSSRSYRKAMSGQDALKELKANSSTQFNPKVVDAFFEVTEKYKESVY